MPYKITIEEIKTEEYEDATTWDQIGEREVERQLSFYESQAGQPRTRIERVMGYLPPVMRTREIKRTVYEQTVKELDISQIICQINET